MIAILQPHIPHYREAFFEGMFETSPIKVYCYNSDESVLKDNFKKSTFKGHYIKNYSLGPFLVYSLLPFLKKDCNKLVLMLHFGHISTWLLLFLKPFHKKKIILWGQGISVKRYLKEEKMPSILLKVMIYLADAIWVYTKKEEEMWTDVFPNKKITALNNTISNIEEILNLNHFCSIKELKNKYNIKQEKCFIFCARFNSPYRRIDLLEEVINRLDKSKWGFIIIGSGDYKPDFSIYTNVYDFGTVYDKKLKDDLFTIADLYIQPGWVGLSIVEALAYGKPVVTFKRSDQTLQCVEYTYLIHRFNSLIFSNIEECINNLISMKEEDIKEMSINACKYVRENLTMANMIENSLNSLNSLGK
ncbi:glycosyltransferase [Lutibacter holmesii]|uniref:Glycosyltransferase n=1 Tax=Lutibacter holmesii TaxID=1137985 RepID=A0ABW3WQR7_9FLAO